MQMAEDVQVEQGVMQRVQVAGEMVVSGKEPEEQLETHV